jgi:DNA-binding YbaB/EbfC family protein
MMRQLQKMQQEMVKAQEDIEKHSVEGAAAGGLVTVTMTGQFRITKVTIAKDAVDPDDVETLEDLVIAACNDARNKADAYVAQRMGPVTGGMKIPGLS